MGTQRTVPPTLQHVAPYLVEAPQRDGAHHDLGLEAQAVQETRALERYVRRADAERLARRRCQREDVVGRDDEVLARDAERARAPTHGNHKLGRGDLRALALQLKHTATSTAVSVGDDEEKSWGIGV